MHFIKTLAKQFAIDGDLQQATAYGTGHINDTYVLDFDQDGVSKRTVLQRINQHVFPDPYAVMENFEVIVGHIGRKVNDHPKSERCVLRAIATRGNQSYHVDSHDEVWRMTHFIENTVTHDIVRDLSQLREAGRAFGQFQQQLSDLPAEQLTDTISNFHHARLRFDALQAAISADPCRRAQQTQETIRFALDQEPLVDVLLNLNASGTIPTRVTHNDTKINNLLFDAQSGEALCVTDLDTTMAGLALYDFGDLVRSSVSLSAEDEPNLDLIHADLDRFRAVAHGYLDAAHGMLNSAECAHLVHASQLMTFVIGVRFLTDHLNGDRYFKIHRPNHNLDRARSQFKLVASMQSQAEQMKAIVANWQPHEALSFQ